jgi:hypothetical protein
MLHPEVARALRGLIMHRHLKKNDGKWYYLQMPTEYFGELNKIGVRVYTSKYYKIGA